MENLVNWLAIIAGALLAVSWIAAIDVAWHVRRRWLFGIGPLLLLVFPVFFILYPKESTKPMILYGLSWLTLLAAVIAFGDLIVDSHPQEVDRTFREKLCGCAGGQLQQDWESAAARDPDAWLKDFPFEADAAGHNSHNALALARASALAYESDAMIFQTARNWGFPAYSVRVLRSGSHTALVLANDSLLVVSFRGTDDPRDWLANLSLLPKDTPCGIVHKGFWDALDLLWPLLQETLTSLHKDEQALWLTGHSLGGALALLAAVRLKMENNQDIAGLYTFGQPQVGREQFLNTVQAQLDSTYVRSVIHVDAVANSVMTMEHTGLLHYFDTQGRLHHGEASAAQSLRDAHCARRYDPGIEFGVHHVNRYIHMFERLSTANTQL